MERYFKTQIYLNNAANILGLTTFVNANVVFLVYIKSIFSTTLAW